MNVPLLVAQFISIYGMDTFRNGDIGWKMFWLLSEQIKGVLALQRVNLSSAVAVGAGLVMGSKEVLKYAKDDNKEASAIG